MVMSSRLLSHRLWQKLQGVKSLNKDAKLFSSVAQTEKNEAKIEGNKPDEETIKQVPDTGATLLEYRHIYPEFIPNPEPKYRNILKEKLERFDMLARRSRIAIPEFYAGSIMAVTYSEPHAPGKVNRFVGICLSRSGAGLRAKFVLRNVIDNQGVEVLYNLYDPAIQKIQCLRLEKRLDDQLFYLRDAPNEYSTFPFDMEPEILPDGTPVTVNPIKVPLKPPPWLEKYELKNYKGLQDFTVSLKRQRKARKSATPWEKYDLMKIYRETIPEEDQSEIFAELHSNLRQLEIEKSVLKRKRVFTRPKKAV